MKTMYRVRVSCYGVENIEEVEIEKETEHFVYFKNTLGWNKKKKNNG